MLSQTTCETSQKINNDLNIISVKKCLINKNNTNSLQNDSRQINTKNLENRFLTVRKIIKRNKISTTTHKKNQKNKVSSLQNDIGSSGIITKQVNNTIELESLSAFHKNVEVLETFNTVDMVPQFKGCKRVKTKKEMKSCFNTEIISFVNDNIIYPENAINAGVNGKVTVKFVIDKLGDVSNINVTGDKSLRLLKEEVIKLIYSLPKFKPAVKETKTVPVNFEFSLNFTL